MNGGIESTIEVERKYSVGAGFAMPDLSGLPAVASVTPPHTYHLTAVYADTADFRLAAAHVTLRRRTGGTDAGWHLKLPAGAARREVHAPLGAGTTTVPAVLTDLVPVWTEGRPLHPIARLQTARTVRRLGDAAGHVLAEVADDHVTGSLPGPDGAGWDSGDDAWRVSITWREIEVELVQGSVDLLDAAGALLLRAGARPSAAASKLSFLLTTAGALPAHAADPGAGPEPPDRA